MPKINIKCEHANVRTLGFFEQGKVFAQKPVEKKFSKRVVQIFRDAVRSRKELGKIVLRKQHGEKSILPASYSSAMSLANLLFPNNFPRIIATGLKEQSNLHSSVVYSKLVPLKKESQRGINSFYTNRMQRRGLNFLETPYHKYSVANKTSIREVARKLEESGLVINDALMNVGISQNGAKKSFVFFEVSGIDLFKIRKYINALPTSTASQKLLKAQAERLVSFIESQEANGPDMRVNTHSQVKTKITVR